MARYLILVSRWNEIITKSLLSGAEDAFADAGVTAASRDVIWVPGCFELGTLAARAARSGRYTAIVCLGAVIRGETTHYDYVAGQAAASLARVGVETGVATIFGVVTTETVEQALNRAGLKSGNKGAEAAHAALAMARATARLEELIRQ